MSAAERSRLVSLVAVGDELLAGLHPDLNSPELARRLLELGFETRSVRVVGDEEQAIASAIDRALDESSLVIVTGGLGPTLDDLTRHGAAAALGRGLVRDEEAVVELERWFAGRGRPMPEANLRQALLPEGAVAIRNRVGTAPGFRALRGDSVLVVLPGPPAEMRVVFHEEVAPWLLETGRALPVPGERRFHLFGLSESLFAERVGSWMDRDEDPRMGCSVKKGVLSVVLRALPGEGSAERLARREAEFRAAFAEWIFSEESPDLERALGRALIERGITVSLAESCTGGLVASLLTRVPGISAVFPGGVVSYADAVKRDELGVPADLLATHGAVSGEVAEAMALGAARRFGTRLAISVTGIAGPDGGSTEKPVGLVWIGSALDGKAESTERRFPPGERNWIRTLSARAALFEGLRRLERRAKTEPSSPPPH